MQGIAGFFKSVIKPYTIPVGTDNDETPRKTDAAETSTHLTIDGIVTDSDQNRPEVKGPVKVDGMKTEVPTKTVIEHDSSLNDLREMVYDLIKDIKDPEKPNSLEELDVVSEQDVCVCKFSQESYLVQITFVPTVPHCSLASLIGLCLRQKLIQDFPEKHKLDIFIKEGTHETAEEVNKQINDKERIAAALENPNLRELVDQCISNDFG